MKVNYEDMIKPAIRICKATGQERTACLCCGVRDGKGFCGFKKGDNIVELFSSSYKGNTSYTNRFHYNCFLKVLAFNFSEIFDDEIRKEIIIQKLK